MRISEISEAFKISLDAMLANKMRSFLASLGVLIGISFVIIMGWVLDGLNSAVDETFSSIGADVLYVAKYDWAGGKSWKETRQRKNIGIKQVNDMMDMIPSAEIVYPSISTWGGAFNYNGEKYSGFRVTGTTFEHSLTPSGTILQGRHFSQFEDIQGENVTVIGHNIHKKIFDAGSVEGKTIKINGHDFTIIGVIDKQGNQFMEFLDNQIYVPMKAYHKVYGRRNLTYTIGVKAGSVDKLDAVRDEVRGAMRSIRGLKPHEEDDFSINEMKAFEKQMESIRTGVASVGYGFAVLSFIVGIIGIMNVMFVSVVERTKEIGIRKALGAKRSSILLQFLSESILLCLFGAIFSFILCSAIAYIGAEYVPIWVSDSLSFLSHTLPYYLFLIATPVALGVGIVAGIIPAFRAAWLDPVDAMRSE